MTEFFRSTDARFFGPPPPRGGKFPRLDWPSFGRSIRELAGERGEGDVDFGGVLGLQDGKTDGFSKGMVSYRRNHALDRQKYEYIYFLKG